MPYLDTMKAIQQLLLFQGKYIISCPSCVCLCQLALHNVLQTQTETLSSNKNTMAAAVSLHGLCIHLQAMLSTTIHVVKPIAIHHRFLMGCASPLDRPKFGRLGPFASTLHPTVGAKIGVLVVSTHTRLDRDLNLLFWFLLLRLTIAACSVQRVEWRC